MLSHHEALTQIKAAKLVAILRHVPADKLDGVVEALIAGGVRVLEFTFDHDSAECVKENAEKIRHTAEKYGDEQVYVWRRSYDVAPAPLPEDDPRNPRFDPRYAGIPDAALPRTESLKDTVARTMPYWECEILPALARHDELLVVAHGNSLRGIIKNLKGISDEAISEFNLPTAVPYVFEFDEGLGCVKDYFLGDPAEIASLMEAVANQGRRG